MKLSCIFVISYCLLNFIEMQQSIVKKLRRFFPSYPVEKAWVFGSYARGEETRKSDIDIIVRFDKNAHISLFDYAGIMNDLEDLFHKKIDLVEEGQLRRWAQESAEQDKILVYERES
jgi:predicted nucleotidyltransferase